MARVHVIQLFYIMGHSYHGYSQEKEEKAYLALYSPTKPLSVSDLNVNLSSDHLVAEGCGQI